MAVTAPNPLLSTGRASDSSLSVQLHPLVLLTITDYITRHTLREQEGPIVGAIIGQQNGREVTMEHAFECKLKPGEAMQGEETVFVDEEWFSARLEQFKDVHKVPALDLVAVFIVGPQAGPLPQHIPILQQLQASYNEDLILLLFHPDTVLDGSMTGGKLPITLYESYYEPGSENADKGFQIEGLGMGRQLQMRFKELGFEVETGEAEMIGVDFVAKGGGNATAIRTSTEPKAAVDEDKKGNGKGKSRAADASTNGAGQELTLSSEDEEMIASLTGKANAIRMLHSRVNLIQSYLSSIPPCYLTEGSLPTGADATGTPLNHPLLRNISSMLSRLPLLAPPSTAITWNGSTASTFQSQSNAGVISSLHTTSAAEQSDVHLISLLSALTKTVEDAREFGNKFSVVQKIRQDKKSKGDTGYGQTMEDASNPSSFDRKSNFFSGNGRTTAGLVDEDFVEK